MEGMVPAAQMALCHRWHLPSACLSKWCRRGIASLQSAAPPPPARCDPLTRVSDGSGEFVLSAQWARPGLFPAGSPAAAPGRALPLAPHARPTARQPLNLLFFMHMKGGGHGEINLPGHKRGTKVYTAGQPFRPLRGDALALLGFLPSSPLDAQTLSEVIKRPDYPRCNTTDIRRGN